MNNAKYQTRARMTYGPVVRYERNRLGLDLVLAQSSNPDRVYFWRRLSLVPVGGGRTAISELNHVRAIVPNQQVLGEIADFRREVLATLAEIAQAERLERP